MFFLDEEDEFVENLPVSNEWKKEDFQGRPEASATSDISINFSGSENIFLFILIYLVQR